MASFSGLIDRLKELRRKYDSEELDADSTFVGLAKLDEEFEQSPHYGNEDLADQFYDMHSDLYHECSSDMESSENNRIKDMTSPASVVERLRNLKHRHKSGQLEQKQVSAELRKVYNDFKALECSPNKKALNEFCDLCLDLESICGTEIEPEKQEDFTTKLWNLRIDEIEAKARNEIVTATNEEIISLHRSYCGDHYFGSKRKYDFLRRQLKAHPNKEFAAIKYLFEECCLQLEVLEQVRKRGLAGSDTQNNTICK
jgi:hypothetical protein